MMTLPWLPSALPMKSSKASDKQKRNEQMLTFYILIWPAISAVVLAVIVIAFLRELRQAKKEGRKLV